MARNLSLNCDLGESFGPWVMGNDKAIMPLIDAANIACGGHAGDASTMRECVVMARRHGTEIGAHISYPDKQGFGRRAMNIRGQSLIDPFSIFFPVQCTTLSPQLIGSLFRF